MILIFCRNLEDFVTWVDTSAIKKHVLEYNNEVGTPFVSLLPEHTSYSQSYIFI